MGAAAPSQLVHMGLLGDYCFELFAQKVKLSLDIIILLLYNRRPRAKNL
mgnify:FL=1